MRDGSGSGARVSGTGSVVGGSAGAAAGGATGAAGAAGRGGGGVTTAGSGAGRGGAVVTAAGTSAGGAATAFFSDFLAGCGSLASFSRRRRTTGASTVEEADRTNSPMSPNVVRTVLLSTPSSFASS